MTKFTQRQLGEIATHVWFDAIHAAPTDRTQIILHYSNQLTPPQSANVAWSLFEQLLGERPPTASREEDAAALPALPSTIRRWRSTP